MNTTAEIPQRQSLREQVERLLPAWQSWYPSLFHAAEDLGLIRARVCAPSSLMLSNRHAAVQDEALRAFKEQWSVEDEPEVPQPQHLQMIRRIQNQARFAGKNRKPTPQRRPK
ncbi:MAG TPA: hypothetical protein VKB34_02855 [Povalibacter sp.]|nr:hypothetical protein [Povalibacter sp.]